MKYKRIFHKPNHMKKKEDKLTVEKTLKVKLIAAVHKVLNNHKAELTEKIQKVVNKSIKKIVKKTEKQINKTLPTQ